MYNSGEFCEQGPFWIASCWWKNDIKLDLKYTVEVRIGLNWLKIAIRDFCHDGDEIWFPWNEGMSVSFELKLTNCIIIYTAVALEGVSAGSKYS